MELGFIKRPSHKKYFLIPETTFFNTKVALQLILKCMINSKVITYYVTEVIEGQKIRQIKEPEKT